MRHLLLVILFAVPVALADDAAEADTMNQEIDFLLETVVSSDCVFIRNGKEYGAEAAKDHLTLKRNRGKKYYSTADEFIENIASSSSWSGKPYHIRCGEQTETAGDWFMAVLVGYRADR